MFGAMDGLVVVLGLLMGTIASHEPHLAVWHAALSGGLAELAGMTAGKRKSDNSPWLVALLCGAAAGAACVIPAVPYLFSEDDWAVTTSVLLGLAVALAVTRLSRYSTWRGFAETMAVLLAAGTLTFAGSFT